MEYHGKLHGDTINLNDGLYPSVSSIQSREIHCHHHLKKWPQSIVAVKAEQKGSPHAVLGQGSVRTTGLAP